MADDRKAEGERRESYYAKLTRDMETRQHGGLTREEITKIWAVEGHETDWEEIDELDLDTMNAEQRIAAIRAVATFAVKTRKYSGRCSNGWWGLPADEGICGKCGAPKGQICRAKASNAAEV